MSGVRTNDRARDVWARARLHVWPERYRLVSLPPERLADAAALAGGAAGGFAGLVLERDEVSLAVPEELWRESPARRPRAERSRPLQGHHPRHRRGPGRDGYLAPAATLLAEAGVSIVPICGFLKDHLLVPEKDLEPALAVLHGLIARSRGNRGE